MATRGLQTTSRETDFLERGNIYFACRPRVDVAAARGIEDVQRAYIILSPRGQASYRLIVIAHKRLPAPGREGERKAWGFVETTSSSPDEVEDELDPKTYLTKTRGERRRPAARPAGEGVYIIVRHRLHTHLAYALELPQTPGEVQRALNIVSDGSDVVAVKNPKAPSAVGTGLVGAKPEVARTLGIELNPEHETLATAEIFTDLRMEQTIHPLRPLLDGTWE